MPLGPPVMCRNTALVAAVPGAAGEVELTITLNAPPAAGTLADGGASENTAPSWFTVNVTPAMIRVPERGVVESIGATLYVTVPLPLPDDPEGMVIHGTLMEV